MGRLGMTHGACLAGALAGLLVARAGLAADEPPTTDTGPSRDGAAKRSTPSTEFSASFLVAYGAGGTYEGFSANRYGFGFGARAGVTLASPRLYLGASFLSFRGDSADGSQRRTNILDAEVGYDFLFLRDFLVVRPALALGVAQVITIQTDNAGYPLGLHLAPGVLVALRALPVLISGEIRRDVLVAEAGATTLLFGGGVVL